MVERVPESEIMHYGIIRRSGRYPWGSGGNEVQRSKDFKSYLQMMRDQGLTDKEIAEGLDLSTTEIRDLITNTTQIIRGENQAMATRLRDKGMSTRAIADRMLGDPKKESTVRGWLKPSEELHTNTIQSIGNKLKGYLEKWGWIDVGKGNELHMGISPTNLRATLAALKDEGYKVHPVQLPQLGTDKPTSYKILGHPNSSWSDARKALISGNVHTILDKSDDGGLTFMTPKTEPVSVSSKRIEIRYGDEGGAEMDGVIEIRRGVPDLNLGANRYAQVRVAVDGTHYLKGMAIYADDLPAGTDIRYNTPKSRDVPVLGDKTNSILKPLDLKPESAGNRFGAITRPQVYIDSKGKEQTSALNIVNEEGDWDRWSRTLASQVLSKQSLSLARTQLQKARIERQEDLKEIMALENPIVKQRLLLDFADSVDSAAVHLKAAALPRQSSHVILPMTSMRPNEIYAPNFNQGEKVALIRYPHGGPFEIPQLTVNNNNTTAKRLMGTDTRDAVGIHPSVAQQLSGADFDGDSVLVIPNDENLIKSKPPLKALEDFRPEEIYPEVPGMTKMTKANTQKEMGKVSNLITDMTIKGASTAEIARAVKHSMVVIDAEKKNLNYKQSEKDNGIAQLKRIYQGGPRAGASTIISLSKSEARIPQQRPRRASEGGPINPETGELEFVPTGNTYTKVTRDPVTKEIIKTEVRPKATVTTKGALAKDAHTLSSGQPIEGIYADHANALKAMANTARKEAVAIKFPAISPAARAIYAEEVASLKAKLKNAQMNAPLERRAQAIGHATAAARIAATPDLDKDDIKKIKYTSLTDARLLVGAGKERIGAADTGKGEVSFTEREWEAIQSGAVAPTTVKEIFNNSDMDRVKQLATPKYNSSLTTGQLALAKSMSASGRSLSEIAAALGIPRSTIADNLANA